MKSVRMCGMTLVLLGLPALYAGESAGAVSACALQKLTASDGAELRDTFGNQFGFNLALSGDRLAVIAETQTYGFVRRGGQWEETAIVSTNTSSGGSDVAQDGERVVVGARNHGAAVFRWVDDDLVPEVSIPSPTGSEDFGQFVAIHGDSLAIRDEGAVRFFRRIQDGVWEEEDIVTSEDGVFGWGLGADENRVVIGHPGAEQALVYRRIDATGKWALEGTLEAPDDCGAFGSPVAIRGDVAVVGGAGGFFASTCGAVYVFRFSGDSWGYETTLTPPQARDERFGQDVAVDEGVIVVGEYREGDSRQVGLAHVFTHDGTVWKPGRVLQTGTSDLSDSFGTAVGVSGGNIAIGANADAALGNRSGAVYVSLGGRPVDISISGSPLVGTELVCEAVTADESVVEHRWSFGDGVELDGPVVSHSFQTPGLYTVRLDVSYADGSCGTTSRRLVVERPSEDMGVWSSADVGRTGFPGAARLVPLDGVEGIELCGTGPFLQGSEDAFHFVHQEVTGDIAVTARIASFEGGADGSGQIGVTLRESLAADAPHATMTFRRSLTERFRFDWREATGGDTASRTGSRVTMASDAWVQIRREGNEFSGFTSTNGVVWEKLHGLTIPGFGPEAVAGVVLLALEPDVDPASLVTPYSPGCGLVTHVRVGDAEVTPVFRRGDANSDGVRDISDGLAIVGNLLLGRPAPVCQKSADMNDSGAVDIADASYIFNHLFLGGAAPPAPFPDCGEDLTEDELTCLAGGECAS